MSQTSSMPRIRVALVDDHEVVRAGFQKYFEQVHEFEFLEPVSNGAEALELAARFQPDVFVSNIRMKGMDGFKLTEVLGCRHPAIGVLIASANYEVEMVYRAVQAGAKGFISKVHAPMDEYIRAIKTIAEGGKYFGKSVASPMFKPSERAYLTPLETEVLMLIARGHSDKSIANKMNIDGRGVEAHRMNLRDKLNIHSDARLTTFALNRRGFAMLKTSLRRRIRVALVGDHEVGHDSLRRYLTMVPEFEVLEPLSNSEETLEFAARFEPDVFVVDIRMDGMDGFELTEVLACRHPTIGILISSVHYKDEIVHRAVQAGAQGYVSKGDEMDEYVRAILTIAAGGKYFGKSVANPVRKQSELAYLTSREISVLNLIARGDSNKSIARELNIGRRGVDAHRLNLRDKLSIHSDAHLTTFALNLRRLAMLQTSSTPRIRVALVDDHEVVLLGLQKYLEMVPAFEVLEPVSNGAEALELAARFEPNVFVVDIRMNEMDGFELTELLGCRHPDIGVLIASANYEDEMVHRAVQAGAQGYVSKVDKMDEYIRAIQTIAEGGKYFGKSVANAVFKPCALACLTPREIEVLILIARGHSNNSIANQLNIGRRGVEAHRRNLRDKLNIRSEAELTIFALRHGLIDLEESPAKKARKAKPRSE